MVTSSGGLRRLHRQLSADVGDQGETLGVVDALLDLLNKRPVLLGDLRRLRNLLSQEPGVVNVALTRGLVKTVERLLVGETLVDALQVLQVVMESGNFGKELVLEHVNGRRVLEMLRHNMEDDELWQVGSHLLTRTMFAASMDFGVRDMECILDGLTKHGSQSMLVLVEISKLLTKVVQHEFDNEVPEELRALAQQHLGRKEVLTMLHVGFRNVESKEKHFIRGAVLALCRLAETRVSEFYEESFRINHRATNGLGEDSQDGLWSLFAQYERLAVSEEQTTTLRDAKTAQRRKSARQSRPTTGGHSHRALPQLRPDPDLYTINLDELRTLSPAHRTVQTPRGASSKTRSITPTVRPKTASARPGRGSNHMSNLKSRPRSVQAAKRGLRKCVIQKSREKPSHPGLRPRRPVRRAAPSSALAKKRRRETESILQRAVNAMAPGKFSGSDVERIVRKLGKELPDDGESPSCNDQRKEKKLKGKGIKHKRPSKAKERVEPVAITKFTRGGTCTFADRLRELIDDVHERLEVDQGSRLHNEELETHHQLDKPLI